MSILINKAHYPVTVLGPGRRIAIWLQGCSIKCPGCVSRDTWEVDEQYTTTVEAVVAWCRQVSNDRPDGITLSGGEPFDQPDALAELLDGLHRWRAEEGILNFDILAYSGYSLATLRRHHTALLTRLDAIIPEPFVHTLPNGSPLCGSANQSVVPLSPLGQQRYGTQAMASLKSNNFQLNVQDGRIWFVGIPVRGDMDRLEQLCAARGLTLGEVSWRG